MVTLGGRTLALGDCVFGDWVDVLPVLLFLFNVHFHILWTGLVLNETQLTSRSESRSSPSLSINNISLKPSPLNSISYINSTFKTSEPSSRVDRITVRW